MSVTSKKTTPALPCATSTIRPSRFHSPRLCACRSLSEVRLWIQVGKRGSETSHVSIPLALDTTELSVPQMTFRWPSAMNALPWPHDGRRAGSVEIGSQRSSAS